MKYRIVKWHNGKFAIQKKFLFWWKYFEYDDYEYEVRTFNSLEEAKNWFNRPYDDSIVETFET